MIKSGDIVEWLGASMGQKAVATESENGEIRVTLPNGCTLSLSDILGSRGLLVNGQPCSGQLSQSESDQDK